MYLAYSQSYPSCVCRRAGRAIHRGPPATRAVAFTIVGIYNRKSGNLLETGLPSTASYTAAVVSAETCCPNLICKLYIFFPSISLLALTRFLIPIEAHDKHYKCKQYYYNVTQQTKRKPTATRNDPYTFQSEDAIYILYRIVRITYTFFFFFNTHNFSLQDDIISQKYWLDILDNIVL